MLKSITYLHFVETLVTGLGAVNGLPNYINGERLPTYFTPHSESFEKQGHLLASPDYIPCFSASLFLGFYHPTHHKAVSTFVEKY